MDKIIYGRNQAAEELGTTVETLRWAEEKGKIKPKKLRVGGMLLRIFDSENIRETKEYLKKVR